MTVKADLPETMTAAVYRRYGGPEELVVEQVPTPTPESDEILVRIHASTVNRTDCGFLRGKPRIVRLFSGLLRPRSTILGCEFAGEIAQIGSDVTQFSIGDRVLGFKDDDFGFGGHAEFTAVPERAMLALVPHDMSYEMAAPALEGAHYALHYIRAAGIGPNQQVLINGTTGAIGSAALQIIKHLGASVTAVCAGEHIDTVRSLGADDVVNYETQDFTQLPQTFDAVFDAVGKSTFGKCRRLLSKDGFYMSTELGPYSQNPFLAIVTRFVGTQRVLFPIPRNTREDAEYLTDLLRQKAYRPLIDREYPLEKLADAYRYVETGMKTGNVVVTIA